jgi:hypothetical protein
MSQELKSDDERESNPYLTAQYDSQTLTDILKMAESNLKITQETNPTSPTILGYQTTIKMLSLALAFKKR